MHYVNTIISIFFNPCVILLQLPTNVACDKWLTICELGQKNVTYQGWKQFGFKEKIFIKLGLDEIWIHTKMFNISFYPLWHHLDNGFIKKRKINGIG